jgi:HPt (histidine-containing phosphotransfer) domain-containing protein
MGLLAEAGDAGGLGRTAHALKGSASNLGARGLARLCEQVEVRARSGELSAAAALFPAIARELERVLLALRQDQSAAPAA